MALAKLFYDDDPSQGAPQAQPGQPQNDLLKVVDPGEVQKAASQSAGGYSGAPQGKTKTGNPKADWFSLIAGMPATKESIASAFPTFAEWYPGSSYQKADIQGPWGWADVIGNLDSGNGHWQWYTGSGGGGMKSPYAGVFSDPLTKQYEQLLQQQVALYKQQQQQYAEEAQRKQLARQQTEAETKRLQGFLNERIASLGRPAYTDSEFEVFRTRALDPIERDRTASLRRALDNIGSRGFDPSSGIAQQLLGDVNRAYDESRAGQQNELAYRQIQEQRSREQEKQALMQYLAQLPLATATGDLNFLQSLNNAINQASQNAVATGSLLHDLPIQHTQLGAQILGLGGTPQSSVPNVMALLNNAKNQQYQNQNALANYFNNVGYSFGF